MTEGKAERVPVRALDVFNIRYVSDAQISADGGRVAFVRTDVDPRGDGYSSAVWLLDRERRAATVVAKGRLPRLAPREEAVALADGSDLWVVGAGRRSTVPLPGPVRELRWQPQARLLAVVVDLPGPERDTPLRDGLHHIRRGRVAIDGEGYTTWRWPQLLVVDPAAGTVQQLTREPFGASGVAWSPGGDRLAYIRPVGDPDIAWTREVCVLAVGGGEAHAWGRGIGIQNLEWAPKEDRVAFRAGRHDYRPSMNLDLWSLAPGHAPELLTPSLDRFVGNDRALGDSYWAFQKVVQGARWEPDGRSLVFIAADRGRNRLLRVPAGGGVPAPIEVADEAVVFDFDLAPATGEIAATVATETRPSEIWCLPHPGPVTDVNEVYAEGHQVTRAVRVEWQSTDAHGIEGWIYSPSSSPESAPPPLALLVHGGPYRQHSIAFNHEVQTLVGHGYAVFCPNPRGSQGYGEAFASAIDDDWGHHDYDDLMSGLDEVLRRGYGDPKRLLVLGGSYGGYMVNWIVTHTARFRAAISERSISDLASYLGTADGALTFGRYLFGSPWDPPSQERLRAQSPLAYVRAASTPTLLIHGLDDQVCPVDQSRQFYLGLWESGCEVEMLLFPGECHDLPRSGRPSHRVQRLEWILDWFDRHIQGAAGAAGIGGTLPKGAVGQDGRPSERHEAGSATEG